MSEFKNFRITLHLTHFFQDHRSLCKIFITEKMKNVEDLQNHIKKIFKITDFCLISSGHYVAPCEDIRILQPDDIIMAIPTNSRTIGATSTPMIITTNSELLKETKEGQCLEDHEQFSNCDLEDYSNMHAKKKKKKKERNKRLVESNTRYDNEQDGFYPNKRDAGQEHNIELEVNTVDKSKKHKKLKSNIEQNEKRGRKHFSFDFPNSSISDISQIDTNSSTRTKIMHSEKQPLNDESLDRQKLVPKINNVIENQGNEINKIDLPIEEKLENSFDCIKEKTPKLYIHKRKSDLICYDLPKKSNIVKNILVSNNRSTANVSESISKCDKPYMCRNGAQTNSDDQFSENHNPLLNEFPNLEKSSCQIKNNLPDEHKQIKINNSQSTAILEFKEPAVSNSLHKTINISTIDNFENSDLKEECSMNDKYKYTNSTSVNKPEEYLEYKSISFEKHIGDVKDVNFKQPTQSSQSENLDIPCCAKDSQQIVNISLEANTVNGDHSCSTVSDKYDTVSFITKRKRKRTYRKRKSKTSINSSPISSTAQSDYCKSASPITATAAVHIKFSDDGEPINCTAQQEKTEEQLENISSQIVGDIMNTTVQAPEFDKISKLETLIHENKASITNNVSHVTINDTIELDNKVSISGMLSEDIISKSPIMTSTKPKPRDLIAFKMLRLTENYTPEVSKHIIGEILSFNEITSNVDLKIIDGLDQCAQPGGKFSLEDSDRELCRTKSYCWTSLIEPRLIFP